MGLSLSRRVSGTTPYYNLIRRVAFPSTMSIVISSLVVATIGVGFSFLIAERTIGSFLLGAAWGLAVFVAPGFFSDIALYLTIMKGDPLFYFRRCIALSLFTITTWVFVFLVSSCLALTFSRFIFPDFAIIIGLFAVVPLRAIAVFSMSKMDFARRTIFTLSESTVTVMVAVLAFSLSPWRMAFSLVMASLVGLTFAFALIAAVEVYGRKTVGFSPIRMFRAFLLDLLEGSNGELESYLNELGSEAEIDVTAFAFRQKDSRSLKSVMLASNFHPGPFTNIGSSVLPYLFQRVVERRFGAIALVPHGVSGHQLNLVSQAENRKVIGWVLSNLEGVVYHSEATPVKRASSGIATSTSQVFDDCALVTMTTSPEDMEDIPSRVRTQIIDSARGRFRHIALIDAHNCLARATTMSSDKLTVLQEAALASLQASADEGGHGFRVGVARRIPTGFDLKDGIGPAGIAVLGIEVAGQRFAYITIDGNNMIKGLREQILGGVRKVGFDDAEVMTTDTHMVNGIVPAPLGYRLVGDVIPWKILMNEVNAACLDAVNDMEPCEVGVMFSQLTVRTLGSKSLKRVMRLVHRISELTALTLFPMIVLVMVISLLFLV